VLAVGSSSSTPSCFTVEWGPAGTSQVYNYMGYNIPSKYTSDFENAGNSITFLITGKQNELPNGEVKVTSFSLKLIGVTIATLTPSQMLNYTTGKLLKGADGPIFYDHATGQNFDIVGPGGGLPVAFASGSGTITYSGSSPQNPPQAGGLISFLKGGTTTVESSNIFYGIPSKSGSTHSQDFGITP
jgi:hypothetical protein